MESLRELQAGQAGGDLNSTHLDACYRALRASFDEKYGGFGRRPKFPTPHTLGFLLRYHHLTGEEEAVEMAAKTLRKIRLGGVYDQVGLGLHRYSTDELARPPFREDALRSGSFQHRQPGVPPCYEGSLFPQRLPGYLESSSGTSPHPRAGSTPPRTPTTRERKESSTSGREGARGSPRKEDAAFFAEIYNFEDAGNYLDESTHKRTGGNIPHLSLPLEKLADERKLDPGQLVARAQSMRAKLFALRMERIHPQKDDKVLTDWNGLMISAFARAGRALGERPYLDTAKGAADFCLRELRDGEGRLLKRWREGKAGLPAHLEDYAFFVQGLLDLYEATFDSSYLKAAGELTDLALEHFEDEEKGGFFLTADDGEKLLVRPKEIYDGAIPSGNSVMALNLLRLSKVTGEQVPRIRKQTLFRLLRFWKRIPGSRGPAPCPVLCPWLTCGDRFLRTHQKPRHENDGDRKRRFLLSVLLFHDPAAGELVLRMAPFLKNQAMVRTTHRLRLPQPDLRPGKPTPRPSPQAGQGDDPLVLLGALVKGHYGKGHAERTDGGNRLLQFGAEAFPIGKGSYAPTEVEVGLSVPGHQPAKPGQQATKIEVVKRTKPERGLAEFQDDQLPSRFEHSSHLAKPAGPIGQVSQAEGNGDEIKGIVFEGKAQAILLDELVAYGIKPQALALGPRLVQHGGAKVRPHNGALLRQTPAQRKGHVPAPGSQIEHLARTT